MKDVFKYLKKVDTLIKEGAADDAREMGLEYAGYGKWKDPKTGQVTHKSEVVGKGQTKLVQLTQPEQPKSQEPQQAQEPKTLSDFRKDAPKPEQQATASVTDQMGRVVPGGPTSTSVENGDVKEVEKGLMRGRGDAMSPSRKNQIKQQAQDIIAQLKTEKEAEAAALADIEAQSAADAEKRNAEIQALNDAEAEQIDVEDYKTLDDAVAETQDEIDYANDDDAFDSEYEEFTKEAETMMKTLADRQRKMMEKKFAKFQESLSTIPSATDKRSFLQSMAHAKTFEGRVNAGAGKNNLGYADIQNLMANRDRLMEGYGDGSPEQIKKFVDSVRSNKVSDEFIDASFDILPDAFKKSLSGKGQVTNDKYVSDDKAHKDMHYLGRNEDGTARRGAANNKDRAKLMWRIYLEQGGRDAYTGLPLDLQAMDLEHVRGFNNKDGGTPGKEEWEQRENDDNFTLINSNINQKKVDMSMKDFFEREVDVHKDKSEEDFGGIEKLFEKQNQIGDVGDQLVKTLLGEGGKGLGDGVTREILQEHFGEDDGRYTSLRDEFRKVATDPKDKKKANGMKSKLGKQLLKATGLSRGITDKSGRRTVALQENVYRGFLQSMANAKPADRQRYMDGWAEAIAAGNEAREPKAVNKKLIELGLIDQDILDDKKAGKVFKEEYETVKRVSTSYGKSFLSKYNKNTKFF
jgi:hypothetical protein